MQRYVLLYSEKCENVSNRTFSCIAISNSETVQSCDLIRAHDESSRTSSAQFPESRRRFCNIYQRWSFLYLVFHSNTYFPKHRLFLLKPGLKLGHHLVDGRIVSVYMVVRFHFQPRLSLHVITHKVLKAARWRLSECPGFL